MAINRFDKPVLTNYVSQYIPAPIETMAAFAGHVQQKSDKVADEIRKSKQVYKSQKVLTSDEEQKNEFYKQYANEVNTAMKGHYDLSDPLVYDKLMEIEERYKFDERPANWAARKKAIEDYTKFVGDMTTKNEYNPANDTFLESANKMLTEGYKGDGTDPVPVFKPFMANVDVNEKVNKYIQTILNHPSSNYQYDKMQNQWINKVTKKAVTEQEIAQFTNNLIESDAMIKQQLVNNANYKAKLAGMNTEEGKLLFNEQRNNAISEANKIAPKINEFKEYQTYLVEKYNTAYIDQKATKDEMDKYNKLKPTDQELSAFRSGEYWSKITTPSQYFYDKEKKFVEQTWLPAAYENIDGELIQDQAWLNQQKDALGRESFKWKLSYKQGLEDIKLKEQINAATIGMPIAANKSETLQYNEKRYNDGIALKDFIKNIPPSLKGKLGVNNDSEIMAAIGNLTDDQINQLAKNMQDPTFMEKFKDNFSVGTAGTMIGTTLVGGGLAPLVPGAGALAALSEAALVLYTLGTGIYSAGEGGGDINISKLKNFRNSAKLFTEKGASVKQGVIDLIEYKKSENEKMYGKDKGSLMPVSYNVNISGQSYTFTEDQIKNLPADVFTNIAIEGYGMQSKQIHAETKVFGNETMRKSFETFAAPIMGNLKAAYYDSSGNLKSDGYTLSQIWADKGDFITEGIGDSNEFNAEDIKLSFKEMIDKKMATFESIQYNQTPDGKPWQRWTFTDADGTKRSVLLEIPQQMSSTPFSSNIVKGNAALQYGGLEPEKVSLFNSTTGETETYYKHFNVVPDPSTGLQEVMVSYRVGPEKTSAYWIPEGTNKPMIGKLSDEYTNDINFMIKHNPTFTDDFEKKYESTKDIDTEMLGDE